MTGFEFALVGIIVLTLAWLAFHDYRERDEHAKLEKKLDEIKNLLEK